MAGTLYDWMTILLLGAIFVGVFGHYNVYIPKDQKEKAQKARRSAELEASEIGYEYEYEYEAPKVITYEIRFKRIWYVVLTTTVSIITIVFLIIEDFQTISAVVGGGLIGTIVGVVVIVAASVFIEMILLSICLTCESNAIEELKKHYIRHYGVFVVAGE